MTIKTSTHRRLSVEPGAYSGATADVFDVDGVAYKVFRVYGVASPDRVQARFDSECEAYRRAADDPWLLGHTAAFYGPSNIEDILDGDGKSVRSMYSLDCCYRMELLSGEEMKFLSVRESLEHLLEAQERFSSNGIDLSDSSVFYREDAERFKLIDFKMER